MSLTKVLVANRGEIARRIFRSCRERGIATVAVYSDADAQALHVAEADEAVRIGEAAPAHSYLAGERIIDAARRTGADAIHPGYGFLSERPDFADACVQAGLTFVGPPASAMETMGDKVKARRAMVAAGVPVVPGHDDVRDAATATKVAAKIGFPLMIKAAAGGGGKGMRIVDDASKVEAAFEAAAREAIGAFGDGRIFVERAIVRARHVEIQVMADAHGHVVHLGERDCSVQRRHQKVIEECPCPSPAMSPELRAQMGGVAVKVASAVGYVGAGTVEFLFEETDEGAHFYFLEMNTRLQVEHPVTEAVVGRDLVVDQLRIAAGEPLGFGQDDVTMRGHAIECRLYAEDPQTFLPRPGTLELVRWPVGGGIRVDAAVGSGSEVSPHYDPMIAKLVAWGPDRPAAIARMRRALDDTVLLGIETNLELHRRVLAEPDFAGGAAVTTRYLGDHPDVIAPRKPIVPERTAMIAAAAAAQVVATRSPAAPPADNTPGRWRSSVRWPPN